MADIVWDAPVPPDDLTYYMREISPAPELQLSQLVPTTYREEHTFRWGEITKRNRLAKYRAFDGRIAVSARDDSEDKEVRLAPFSNSLNTSEYERLQLQFMRMQGGNRRVLVDALYNDADNLMATMHNRKELALGTALATTKFTVNENDFMAEADYGVDPANFFTAAIAWTNTATAKAADDMRAMYARYKLSRGVRDGQWIMADTTVSLLRSNAQIVAEAIGTNTGRTRLTMSEFRAWLEQEELPVTTTSIDTILYDEDTASDVRVFPEDKIAIVPTDIGELIEFRFGLSVTALELIRSAKSEMSFGDGAGIVGMVVKDGPPFREFTFVDAVGMPIIKNSKAIVLGDVR